MKSKVLLTLAGVMAVALLPAATFGQPAPVSTPEATGWATIAMPEPGGSVQLAPGCNNIALTFPDGTSTDTVVQAMTPAGSVEAIWRHQNVPQGRFEGYSPAAAQASDLLTVNFLDAVWVCITMPSSLTLSEEDAGSTVELAIGDTMDVVLDGNPTTGFTWETASLDESVLRQLGEPQFESESNLPGAGGKFTFSFEAVGSGQTTLQLIYHRPWEIGVQPQKTFEVTVEVGPGEPAESEGALSAAELLANLVYDEEVRVYGQVSLLGELLCPCFDLTSGGETLIIWYGLMVENDGTPRPPVSVEGVKNGDWVLVTGELKARGTHVTVNDFWASSIEALE